MKRKYYLLFCSPEKWIQFFLRSVSILFFIGLFQLPVLVQAQSNTAHETEARLKKAAEKYFEQQDYADAYPLYSQLLSLYPRDPNYNYRFGACMLFVSKEDINKAVHYIQYGVKQTTVDNLAYYFLGMGLHLNYRFDDAINSYQKFEQGASSGDLKKYPVEQLIGMCKNGKQLVSTQNGLDVLRKKELNFSNLVEAYNMHCNGGSLISEPEDFKTKIDKAKGTSNLMYLTPDRSKVFFASYGNDDKNGKDIYMAERNPNGTLGTPINLGPVINTPYDEDYPIYDAPRNTLFFSSKGHNSMGGYDIFESLYNDSSQTWSEPVNLDFPINTPDDDILFVPDTTAETAFFASTRTSPQGKINVYKIAIHLRPPQSVIIAGTAYKTGGTIPAFCKITIKDSATNNVIGVYTSSSYDGKYSFSLPAGRKYNFTIEDSTHSAQSQSVSMPAETTVSTMQQDIQFDASGRLQINNHTAEVPKDTDSQFALNYIHDRAQMDVNIDTNTIQPLLAKSTPANPNNSSVIPSVTNINSTQNTGDVSPVAITTSGADNTNSSVNLQNNTVNSGMANPDTSATVQAEQQAQALNDKGTKAIDYASDKMEEAEQLQAQANDILNNLDGSSGANVDTARILSSESKAAYEKGMEAYRLAAEEKNEAAAKQLEIDKSGGNSNSSGNDSNEVSTTKVSPADLIKARAEQVKEDSAELSGSNADIQQEVTGLQQQSQNFITQAGQTGDPQQKVALLQQADDLSKSSVEKQEEIKDNNVQLQQLHNEYIWLTGKAQKADNTDIYADANNTNPALQQEINAYAVNNNIDSTDNAFNSTGNEIASNNNPNTSGTSKHAHHKKKAGHTSQTNNTATNSSQPDNTSNVDSNPPINQGNVVATNNSESTPTVNNNVAGNQNTPTTPNNIAPDINPVNETVQPNLTVHSDSTVAVNNNVNNTPSVQELPQTNTLAHSDSVVAANNPVNNAASAPVYHKPNPPTDVLLDSLANANPATQTSNNSASVNSTDLQNLSASTVQYTDVTAAGLNQKSQNYFTAANAQTENAQRLRNQAQVETNKVQAEVLYNQADSIDNLVFELNLKGDEVVADANARQYSANANQIANSPVPSDKSQGDRVALAQSILKEAADSYSKYVTERDSAKNISSLINKRSYVELEEKDLAFAILKQQQAVHLYFQADSAQSVAANNTPVVATTNPNITDNNQAAIVTSPVNNSPTPITTAPVITPTDNTPVAATNTPAPVITPTDNTPVAVTNTTAPAIIPTENMPAVATNATAPAVTLIDNTSTTTTNSNATHHKHKKDAPVALASDSITASTPPDNSSSASLLETANIFKEVRRAAYSPAKPIPIDQSLPKGLVFAVQVGAFRNAIPQNLFKGFEPIIGLTAPEGYVRYIAGIFRTITPAKDAEEKIRNLGYPEAFIVAYYDGKRITIQEALSKLEGVSAQPVVVSNSPQINTQQSNTDNTQGATTNLPLANNVASLVNPESDDNTVADGNNGSLVLIGNTITPSKKALIDTKRKDRKAIKDTVPPEANPISEVKGLVYTVQVGSFSTHRGFTRLRKIKQLYSWTSNDGTIKYNSGTYSNATDAGAAKDIIVANTTVKDAFVSAYYNGKRITTAQARDLLNKGVQSTASSAVNSENNILQKRDSTTNVSNNAGEAPINSNEEIDSSSFAFASQTKVIYTVRIASFTGQLPVRTVNKLLKYASDGIEPHKEAQGVTTYYGGKYTDYAPAEALQQKFIDGGFRKAVVVAYYHGKRISLDVAKSITNK